MAMFIDDGQQQTHAIERDGEALVVTFRQMATDKVNYLLMLLDRESPHYNPHAAYTDAVAMVADCIVVMTYSGRPCKPSEDIPRLDFGAFANLRSVVMGITKPQAEQREEQGKN